MERMSGGYIDMDVAERYDELAEGEGSIQAGPEQQDRLDEFTESLLSGRYHVETDLRIVCGCIDGRCGCTIKPNSAGGTETLMVMDDLTNKQFRSNDNTTVGAYRNILNFLKKQDLPIGGHDDEHAIGDASGCGANDKLADIYEIIARKADYIRSLAVEYGINVDEATHDLIVSNAAARDNFSTGAELKVELDSATNGEYDHLVGDHTEVVAVLNTRFGTSLDRDAVKAEFGDDYKVFNVDVWALDESANVISTTPDSTEARMKMVAGVYYNFGAAIKLAGPRMRVIVLS